MFAPFFLGIVQQTCNGAVYVCVHRIISVALGTASVEDGCNVIYTHAGIIKSY